MITLAEQNDLAWQVNAEGVRIVAETALAVDVRRMVHASSIHAFDQFGTDIISRAALGALLSAPVVDCAKAECELGYRPRTTDGPRSGHFLHRPTRADAAATDNSTDAAPT